MAEVIRWDEVNPSSVNIYGGTAKVNVYADSACTKPFDTLSKGDRVAVLNDIGTSVVQIKYSSSPSNGVAYVSSKDLKKLAGTGATNTNQFLIDQEIERQQSIAAQQTSSNANADGISQEGASTAPTYENSYLDESENTRFKKSAWKMTQAFGVPPRLPMDVDIQYEDDVFPGLGRVTTRTICSNPTILSICPGAVDFLPDYNKEQHEQFYETVVSAAAGAGGGLSGKIKADHALGDGRLFAFKSAFTSYCKVLNVLCRGCAMMLGIGDTKMPNTSIPLKSFDYGYWCLRDVARNENSSDPSIFKDFWEGALQTAGGAVNDNTYIHFYVNNSETNSTETATTTTEPSMLADVINKSGISTLAKNINFLFGGAIGDNTVDEATDSGLDLGLFAGDGFLAKIGKAATNYVKGGRMVIPDMLGEVEYEKRITCSLTFISAYGDPLSVFLNCMVGVMAVYALGIPKQISDNMYTYPYIIRAYQMGNWNTDLAVLGNISLQRGGQDETSWTAEGLATEWTVQFDIVPLYSQLMVTSSDNPFLFMKNEQLLQFLGNMCGIDLKANQWDVKRELALGALKSRFRDIPTSLGRGIGEIISNKVQSFFMFNSNG